jgi:signal transduction histidine kinase
VLSVPVYNMKGSLDGAVSGVVRSNIIRGYLPKGDLVLIDRNDKTLLANHPSQLVLRSMAGFELARSNPDLIASFVTELNLHDDSKWILASAYDDSEFWSSSEVAQSRRFLALGEVSSLLFALISCVAAHVLFRDQNYLKTQVALRTTELAEGHRQIKALIESIPGYVAWLNIDGTYLGGNSAFSKDVVNVTQSATPVKIGSLGVEMDHLLHQGFRDFIAESSESYQRDIFIGTESSRKKFVFSFSKYDGDQKVIMIGTDVTSAWKFEQDALVNRQIAANASRLAELGEIAGGIAHEVNNPLAIIDGKARQLLTLVSKDPINIELVNKNIERIVQMSERISKIITGMRTISRDGSADPMEFELIANIVESSLELSRDRLNRSGVKLSVDVQCGPVGVQCRSVQLSQVIINLVNNSVDAIKERPEPWIDVQVKQLGRQIEVIVTDCGEGIPESLRQKIMTPFFTTKPVGKGTGLGLSISKSIIEAHGGDFIYDDTHPNTRFKIRLPLGIPTKSGIDQDQKGAA